MSFLFLLVLSLSCMDQRSVALIGAAPGVPSRSMAAPESMPLSTCPLGELKLGF